MSVSDAQRLRALEEENRRHSSLGYQTPADYAAELTATLGVTNTQTLVRTG
jgi:hypothetical protein